MKQYWLLSGCFFFGLNSGADFASMDSPQARSTFDLYFYAAHNPALFRMMSSPSYYELVTSRLDNLLNHLDHRQKEEKKMALLSAISAASRGEYKIRLKLQPTKKSS